MRTYVSKGCNAFIVTVEVESAGPSEMLVMAGQTARCHSCALTQYETSRTLMHNFLYSLTICLLHCYPRHVSSINMPIFRRKNCIHTASGIFALCKRLHSTVVESGLQSALNQCTVQMFTESEDTRCCVNTIFPPEDGHVNAQNVSRIIV